METWFAPASGLDVALQKASGAPPPDPISALWVGSQGGGSGSAATQTFNTGVALLAGDEIQIQCNASSAQTVTAISIAGLGIGSGLTLVNDNTQDSSRIAVYRARLAAPLALGSAVSVTWGGTSGNRTIAVVAVRSTPASGTISAAYSASSLTPAGPAISHTTNVPSSDNGLFIGSLFVVSGDGAGFTADPDWTLLGSRAADVGSSILRMYSIDYGAAAAVNFTGANSPDKIWNMSSIGYKEAV